MADDGFVEIGSGDAWSPAEEGDSITGVFVGTKEDVGPNKSKMHNLRKDDGIVGVWGSTVLDDKFEAVREGDTVRVTYTGLSKEKGNFGKPWKTWKLEVKPAQATNQEELPTDGNVDVSDIGY